MGFLEVEGSSFNSPPGWKGASFSIAFWGGAEVWSAAESCPAKNTIELQIRITKGKKRRGFMNPPRESRNGMAESKPGDGGVAASPDLKPATRRSARSRGR